MIFVTNNLSMLKKYAIKSVELKVILIIESIDRTHFCWADLVRQMINIPKKPERGSIHQEVERLCEFERSI